MISFARQHDSEGDYRLIDDGNFRALPSGGFDLVQSAFTFDNISRAAQAYANYLIELGETKALVGYDTRFNANLFAKRTRSWRSGKQFSRDCEKNPACLNFVFLL